MARKWQERGSYLFLTSISSKEVSQMASYYDDLVGWLEEEDREAMESRRNAEVEKEAGEAFDEMMEKPEQILDRIFKGIWTAGGNR